MLPGGERGAGRLEIRGLGCRVSGLYRVVKSLGFKASGAGWGVRGFRVIQGLVIEGLIGALEVSGYLIVDIYERSLRKHMSHYSEPHMPYIRG